MRQYFMRASVWCFFLAFFAIGSSVAAENDKPSATFTVAYDSLGAFFGAHEGSGTLTLNDGSEYAFSVIGYSVFGLGVANATGTGEIYNLVKAADLSGRYLATGGDAVFLTASEGKATLRNNANDVRIALLIKETGLHVGYGLGSLSFTLGKMLKPPRAKTPVAMAPVDTVMTAPVPTRAVIKPSEYVFHFGYNKSRANLAIGREIDSLLAAWKGQPVTFSIVGHADMVGGKKYNLKLSQQRADAVKGVLLQRGVPVSRILARGVGQADLAIRTPPGKRLRQNRRVVVTIQNQR